MAFTILDNDEVFNTNQALWMQTDINALAAGIVIGAAVVLLAVLLYVALKRNWLE